MAAKPDLTPLYDELAKLPREMRSRALAITLDLKVVGKDRYDPDDLALAYDVATEMCTVTLKRAYLREYVSRARGDAAPAITSRTLPPIPPCCRKATSSPLKVVGTCVGGAA